MFLLSNYGNLFLTSPLSHRRRGPSKPSIIIIIIIMSLFKEDNIFSANTNLTYGPHKTWLNTYYLQTVKIYIYTKSSRIL